MGHCIYRFNASEHYQRTPPGCAPDTHCGAQTYPIYDEPEIVLQRIRQPDGTVTLEPLSTGVLLPRATDDPYCPEHGGTPKPDPGLIRMFLTRELETRQKELEALQQQIRAADPSAVPAALQLGAGATGDAPAPAGAKTVHPVISGQVTLSDLFDPAEHTVPEVLEHLRAAAADEFQRVMELERTGRARKTIMETQYGE